MQSYADFIVKFKNAGAPENCLEKCYSLARPHPDKHFITHGFASDYAKRHTLTRIVTLRENRTIIYSSKVIIYIP